MHVVRLSDEVDFDGFRAAARAAARRGVRPEDVRFLAGAGAGEEGGLLSEPEATAPAETGVSPLRVPRRFVDMADWVCRHRDPVRYDLLFAALYRLRETPRLLEIFERSARATAGGAGARSAPRSAQDDGLRPISGNRGA